MKVKGLTAAATNALSEVVTLVAQVAESTVTFQDNQSTFNALSAQAHDGILFSSLAQSGHHGGQCGLGVDQEGVVGDVRVATNLNWARFWIGLRRNVTLLTYRLSLIAVATRTAL